MMAEGSEENPQSQEPGFMLRMTLNGIATRWPKAKHVTTDTLHTWIKEQGQDSKDTLLILDTRPEEEFNISHLQDAIRVSPEADDVHNTINRLDLHATGEHKQRVVCYCALGYRSSKYATFIQDAISKQDGASGNIEIYNLEGSIFKWANENRPLIDHQGAPTVFAHPFNSVFGKFLRKDLRKWSLE